MKSTNTSWDPCVANVDFSKKTGSFNRLLHCSNTAPNLADRNIYDFTPIYKSMNFTMARTHDWPLWNNGQRMVDTHFIFPLMHLDPKDPANYYFDSTDEIIRITREAGSGIFYRLGTSIEHSGLRPDQLHFNSLPPKDFVKYAEVLAGIIRHYTQGWANGFRYEDMEYWEIWNEAENDPTCWKGKYEDFIRFFVVVLKRLKQEFPHLKIGGPATTDFREDLIRPLLKACKEANVAPDFVSWHGYRCKPDDFAATPGMMKKLLAEEGFPNCETFITEWHYLVSWGGIQNNMTEDSVMTALFGAAGLLGIDSAAFNTAMLTLWQDTPLTGAFYYGAAPKGNWGFLTPYMKLNKNYHSMRIFGDFMRLYTHRVQTDVKLEGLYVLGGISDDGARKGVLVSDYRGREMSLSLRVRGTEHAHATVFFMDQNHDPVLIQPDRYGDVIILPKQEPGSAIFFIQFN